ncbi:MAG: YajQ family cyclic di-GMP-binding protein [Gemmatimonadales bacterium]|nr:MAG: YajQ family cyclic di-GMP-binding protein [Gemmatimonadales bacterium]
MAKTNSFDISTSVDLQEVDNAVNQAAKEIGQRYDFKGTDCSLDFRREEAAVLLEADDAYRLEALKEVLRQKLAKRKVPLKNLDEGTPEAGTMGRHRQRIGLKQGIDQETAKKIVKDVKAEGFKKVQVAIQGEELRVSSPSRDDLQEVMKFLRSRDYGVELGFGNYR